MARRTLLHHAQINSSKGTWPRWKTEYSIVMEKSAQFETPCSQITSTTYATVQPQQVNGYPDYSPEVIENPFVIPGIENENRFQFKHILWFELYIEGDCNH